MIYGLGLITYLKRYFQYSLLGGIRLFTITRNKVGPNVVPCGTPVPTDIQSVTFSPRSTRCFRSDNMLHT